MPPVAQSRKIDPHADQAWRLDNLYWITDKEGKRIKFKMNWAQEQLLRDMSHLNIILKARQLGFTTFIQLYLLDVCVFYRDTRAGVIADTRDNAEAIFRDKIKFPYDHLPDGIKAAVPILRDNTTTMELGNNSLIRVGTSLRSGTLQYLHISEFGKICARYPEKAREIVTGALNTIQAGQIAFIESTAEGQEGKFFDMCQAAQSKARTGERLTELDWKFHFYPWHRHPEYTLPAEGVAIADPWPKYFRDLEERSGIVLTPDQKAWYVKKAEIQGEDMKREYPSTPDEAFAASIEGAYYAQQMARAEREGRIGRVPYDDSIPVDTWWDLGMDDATAIWFTQRVAREVRVIDYLEASGEGLPYYARQLRDRGYYYGRHIGPHDISVRELGTGKSRLETAQGLGIDFDTAPRLEIADGIEAVRSLLGRCWFDAEKCALGIKALRSYRKDWDENLGTWKNKPRHDGSSHAADAFRTGAVAPAEEANASYVPVTFYDS